MKLFGRGAERRAREQETREQEAREWLAAHEAGKQARAEAREHEAGGGGISHSGPEDLSISGQAFGAGARVITGPDAGPPPAWPEHGGSESRGHGHEGPYIVSTGGGSVNVQNSAVGHDIHMTNYAEPQPGQELEAGA